MIKLYILNKYEFSEPLKSYELLLLIWTTDL